MLLPSCAGCLEIWEPQPPGTLRCCLTLLSHERRLFTYSFHVTLQTDLDRLAVRLAHHSHLDTEDGKSMFLRNVVNATYFHAICML
jgi:hypothetical protein